MKTYKILALMRWKQNTKNTQVFVGPGSAVRTMYVESSEIPEGQEAVLATVEITLHGSTASDFAQFLEEVVERDDAGRMTSDDLWAGWAAHHCSDPDDVDDVDIAGITRPDASELFRFLFGGPEKTRARVAGRVQRCWAGYRMGSIGR